MTNETGRQSLQESSALGRDIVLQRIRSGLTHAGAHFMNVPEQPVHPVWPSENPSPDAMAERFTIELKAVQGEMIRCATIEDAREQLARLRQSEMWSSFAAVDSPLLRDATASLGAETMHWFSAEEGTVHYMSPDKLAAAIEPLSVCIIEPKALMADTGSCAIHCPTAVLRLLCYLPPACIVIAKKEQLFEHLSAAWPTITETCPDNSIRGEIVIVTGPSRTADIEKILILGVHGPKRLVVLLIG